MKGTQALTGRAAAASERERLAERIGAAVTGLPDVAGLTAGPRAHVVTYRVGPPYGGVAVRDGEIEVGVVARPGRPLAEIAETVRQAVLPLAGGLPVNVLIGDIDDGARGNG
ncbi:hypothetical protein [Actinomadura sp. 9N407]|uniref:hypothetical protein n=1 Tax=Actinomadura sp. 9N407 TaxID=3375154 RepID=UPI0037876545